MTVLTLTAAYLLTALASARLTRLLTHDHYPPAAALRRWWFNQTIAKGGWRAGWALLLTSEHGTGCPFCAAPYVTALLMAAGMGAGIWQPGWTLAGAWWTLAVWASLSYLAAMIVVRDEPE